MPRSARLDAPGALHHIIIRGIERRNIFRDDKDRENFIERLSALLPETRTVCYAWALLPNHAHFLLRSGTIGLATLMRRLLTGHAVRFNRRYDRHGPLFQNRYKSIICQEDIYFKELVRYIHLNPLRAKLVPDIKALNNYRFSGHIALMNSKKHTWQDTKYLLRFFGKKRYEARKAYLAYLEAGIDQGRRPELVGGGLIRSLGGWAEVKKIRQKGQDRFKGDERILGDSEFVTDMLSKANERYNRQYELKQLGFDIKKIEQRIRELFDIDIRSIYAKGRRKSQVEARSVLCYWAARELGVSATELARRLGMTQPGVGYAISRGEDIVKKKKLQIIK